MTKFSRAIIHVDMDAFYASVEQRDHPELKGKPIAVGGKPEGRGVVAAASYEARKFGIRSAMASGRAQALCPQLIFVKPRFEIYRRISRVVMRILRDYTDLVEPLSLDEAFLDVTINKKHLRDPVQIAQEIRKKIFEYTGLTASAGVAPNKFLAKIASDMRKPNGLMVIRPDEVEAFVVTLPVRAIPGIGRVTEEKMVALGMPTVGYVQRRSEQELIAKFGSVGSWYYQIARGIDDRPVQPHSERKSIGAERTFSVDSLDKEWIGEQLTQLANRVAESLNRKQLFGHTVTLKVKYADFDQITRALTVEDGVYSVEDISEIIQTLVPVTGIGRQAVRLVGVAVSGLAALTERRIRGKQLELQIDLKTRRGDGQEREYW